MIKRNLEELKELLIIVDMVNGFINEGKMADSYIKHIISEQVKLIEEFLEKGNEIAFIKDNHDINSQEFNKYPIHCVSNTNEAELIEELKPFEDDSLIYMKNSTSAMFAPKFMNDINKMSKLEKIIITGCCTDICIMNLAIPLQNYFDQNNRPVEIIIPMDAVETYNSNEHNREEYNDMAFKLMKQSGITLIRKKKTF